MFLSDIKNFSDVKSLFVDNKNVKQIIFKNTFWMAASEIISRFLKFFLIIYAARILGVEDYGKFTFAMAFASIFALPSDFGLSDIVTREFSKNGEKVKEYFSILSLKIVLSLVTVAILIVVSFFITKDIIIRKMILVLTLGLIIDNFSAIIYAVFRARQKMEYESLGKIIQALMVTIAGFSVFIFFPSSENLSYSYLLSSLAAFIFIIWALNSKIFRTALRWDFAVWRNFLKISWPLAFTMIFSSVYNYIDSIMLGYWGQIIATGWYNAAYKIMYISLIPMMLISQSFFPILSKTFRESREKLQNVWNYQMRTMIIIAVPLVAGGIVLASKIINFVFGSNYDSSALAFQILMIVAGFIFITEPFYRILIVFNQQKKIFYVTLIGAIINIILNFILIPIYSLYGAAIATVITTAILFFIFMGCTKKFTSISPFNRELLETIIFSVIAVLIMYVFINQLLFYKLHLLLIILIGIAVYLSIFAILHHVFKKSK